MPHFQSEGQLTHRKQVASGRPNKRGERGTDNERKKHISTAGCVEIATEGCGERTEEPRRDRKGPLSWPGFAARSFQMGPDDRRRFVGSDRRSEPDGGQRQG